MFGNVSNAAIVAVNRPASLQCTAYTRPALCYCTDYTIIVDADADKRSPKACDGWFPLRLSKSAVKTTGFTMEFIELSGKTLLDVVNEGEIDVKELRDSGLTGDSIVRINKFGEIELRQRKGWEMVGGLLGHFEDRLQRMTGLDWA